MSLSVILSLIFLRISLRQILKLQVVDPEEGPFLIYFWTKAEALKADCTMKTIKEHFFYQKRVTLYLHVWICHWLCWFKNSLFRAPSLQEQDKETGRVEKKKQNKTKEQGNGGCLLTTPVFPQLFPRADHNFTHSDQLIENLEEASLNMNITYSSIHYFPIVHNALSLPPNFA